MYTSLERKISSKDNQLAKKKNGNVVYGKHKVLSKATLYLVCDISLKIKID